MGTHYTTFLCSAKEELITHLSLPKARRAEYHRMMRKEITVQKVGNLLLGREERKRRR